MMIQSYQQSGKINKQKNIQGAYYVNFPQYKNKISNGFGSGAFGRFVNKSIQALGLQNAKVPLGHAGVMTVDNNGVTHYYEYGRYGSSNIGVNGNGNWNRRSVSNAVLNSDGSINHAATAAALEKTFGQPVELVYIDDADPTKVEQYILNDAKDKNRGDYNLLFKSCGSEACKAIDSGQSWWQNFKNVLRGGIEELQFFPGQKGDMLQRQGYPMWTKDGHTNYKQGGALNLKRMNYLDYYSGQPTKYMEGGGWFDNLKNSKFGQVASTVADSALDFVPGVGTYRAVKEAVANPTWQNIGSAALSGVGDLMTFVPGVGWAAKAAATGLGKVAKAGKVVNAANNVANTMQAVNTANKTLNKGVSMFNNANNTVNAITNTYNAIQG